MQKTEVLAMAAREEQLKEDSAWCYIDSLIHPPTFKKVIIERGLSENILVFFREQLSDRFPKTEAYKAFKKAMSKNPFINHVNFGDYENDLGILVKNPSTLKRKVYEYSTVIAKKFRNIGLLSEIRKSRVSSLEQAAETLIKLGPLFEIDDDVIQSFKTVTQQTKNLIEASESISPLTKRAINQAGNLKEAFTIYSLIEDRDAEEGASLKADLQNLTNLFTRANNLVIVSLMGHVPEVDRIRRNTHYGPAIKFSKQGG